MPLPPLRRSRPTSFSRLVNLARGVESGCWSRVAHESAGSCAWVIEGVDGQVKLLLHSVNRSSSCSVQHCTEYRVHVARSELQKLESKEGRDRACAPADRGLPKARRPTVSGKESGDRGQIAGGLGCEEVTGKGHRAPLQPRQSLLLRYPCTFPGDLGVCALHIV
jgi:hypothetical protein